MKFIKPGSIEFPTCTLLEKNCWKPLVAVKITQVCNGRLHNGLVPKGLKKHILQIPARKFHREIINCNTRIPLVFGEFLPS